MAVRAGHSVAKRDRYAGAIVGWTAPELGVSFLPVASGRGGVHDKITEPALAAGPGGSRMSRGDAGDRLRRPRIRLGSGRSIHRRRDRATAAEPPHGPVGWQHRRPRGFASVEHVIL